MEVSTPPANLSRADLSGAPSAYGHLQPLDAGKSRSVHIQLPISIVITPIGDGTAELPMYLEPVEGACLEGPHGIGPVCNPHVHSIPFYLPDVLTVFGQATRSHNLIIHDHLESDRAEVVL